MKFLAQYKTGCQCCYCIGNPAPGPKRTVRRSQRKTARQAAKKDLQDRLWDEYNYWLYGDN